MCSIPGGEPESLEMMISWIQRLRLTSPPGSRFSFAVVGFDLNLIIILLKESKYF